MARMLLEAGAEPSPRGMDFAAGAGNVQLVRMLLQAGANPSHGLLSAAGNGNAEIVELLLRAGGDPNDARWIYKRRLDLTPLHLAVMKGRLGDRENPDRGRGRHRGACTIRSPGDI